MLALMLLTMSLCANEMPEPYGYIQDLEFDGQGWFGNSKPLGGLIQDKPIQTIIEVGSWLGLSTRFLASHLPDHGKVYAVDTWQGSPLETVHMKDPRLPYLYQLFLSNVKHAGLTHKIVPVRMNSQEAAKALSVKADLIYIDAAHDTASVYKDIMAWYPHLTKQGVMCGDDWKWKSVQKAVIQAANDLDKTIWTEDNFWMYK